jgi:hypothetical protein
VLSHRPPDPSVANYPLVRYVTDGIESAIAQAKAAAGPRNVALVVVANELLVRLVEEPHLRRVHGEVYARYTAAVGRFVPGVGRLG